MSGLLAKSGLYGRSRKASGLVPAIDTHTITGATSPNRNFLVRQQTGQHSTSVVNGKRRQAPIKILVNAPIADKQTGSTAEVSKAAAKPPKSLIWLSSQSMPLT